MAQHGQQGQPPPPGQNTHVVAEGLLKPETLLISSIVAALLGCCLGLFVIGLLFPIVVIVLCVIAKGQYDELEQRHQKPVYHRGMATGAMIISIITLALILVSWLLAFVLSIGMGG
jgi:hypothetical protein